MIDFDAHQGPGRSITVLLCASIFQLCFDPGGCHPALEFLQEVRGDHRMNYGTGNSRSSQPPQLAARSCRGDACLVASEQILLLKVSPLDRKRKPRFSIFERDRWR